ncbi:hypothetical protein EJB05_02316, partial [Eragrostis curvula]
MATDGGGLRRLFEKPMPENPTLLEALSAWNHPKKPIDTASFTEIFGELHFREKPDHRRSVLPSPPSRTTTSWADVADAEADKSKDDSSLDALLLRPRPRPAAGGVKRSASFCVTKKKGSSASASSLLLCTEGLGSESTVDADDMFKDADAEAEAAALSGRNTNDETDAAEEGKAAAEEEKRPPLAFPPPIRSIGRGGKPSVCFRSFRADGRFVLMEVVIPGKEILQAYREGGRLRLQFAGAAAVAAAAVGNEEVHDGEHKRHAGNAFTPES